MKKSVSNVQVSILRVVLGLYLFHHFLSLLPWGAELFSSAGVLPWASLSPLARLFPNVFLVSDDPRFVIMCLIAGMVFSFFFTIGKADRVMAVLLWYLWACFYGRNPLIGNPSLPFIGWLLLAWVLIPSPSLNAQVTPSTEKSGDRQLPSDIVIAAWILMCMAYSYSGCTKLVSLSWLDGSALSRVLANPLARDTVLRTFMLSLPVWLLRISTWTVLALELSFAPLALFRRLRPFIWLAMVGLHVTLLFLINFADLTAGMLILHLFTFDPAWLRSARLAGKFHTDRKTPALMAYGFRRRESTFRVRMTRSRLAVVSCKQRGCSSDG